MDLAFVIERFWSADKQISNVVISFRVLFKLNSIEFA